MQAIKTESSGTTVGRFVALGFPYGLSLKSLRAKLAGATSQINSGQLETRERLYTCPVCRGKAVPGTEENCDYIWCDHCVDYVGDLPR